VDAAVGEVDVAPEQLAELLGAGAGEDERGDDRAAVAGAPVRLSVELGGGVEQRLDLLGAVKADGGAAAASLGRQRRPAAGFAGRWPYSTASARIDSAGLDPRTDGRPDPRPDARERAPSAT
jgi:hypothetical protein